ncbi:MAG: PrgI family protein [Candidatus Dormibacteria bacterium]
MQAEVPQPISGVPLRWGGFTVRQLGWIAIGAALPYVLLRLQLAPEVALAAPAPWLVVALCFAVGRREGRQLDSWVADWLRFRLQPRRLRHPGKQTTSTRREAFIAVDQGIAAERAGRLPGARTLPWVDP